MSGYDDSWGSGSASIVNQTFLCAERSIHRPIAIPFTNSLVYFVKSFLVIYFLIIFILGTFLNSLVIILVWKFKKLRKMHIVVSLQIVVLDLFTASIASLPSLANVLAYRWLFGSYMCAFVGFLSFCTKTVRTVLMLVLVMDRFLSVFSPFFHPKHKYKITVSLSVLAWLTVLLFCIGALPGLFDCYTFSNSFWSCGISPLCSKSCATYVNLYTILVIAPSCVLPIILYFILYLKARKLRNATISLSSSPSNYNVRRGERRATITFLLLFVSVFVVLVPTIIFSEILSSFPSLSSQSFVFYLLVATSLNLSSFLVITDPIIILRNRDSREILSKLMKNIFQKWCPPQDNN